MQDSEAPIWSIVDPLWYRNFYPVTEMLLESDDNPRLDDIYKRFGQKLGHSPNPYFHELWYLERNPDVKKLVLDGDLGSGFSHFSQFGWRDRAPHWLFDPVYYATQFEARHGHKFSAEFDADCYGHFLSIGQREGLAGHYLFDAAVFEANGNYETGQLIHRHGPFSAFISRLGLVSPEPVTSNFFQPAWYLQHYPEVAEAVTEGIWSSALEHYLTNDTPLVFDPSPLFSEAKYLAAHPDVREAAESKHLRNGFEHFCRYGRAERRIFFSAI